MSDEIRDELNEAVTQPETEDKPEQLESPLVVHKKGDASYSEVNTDVMNETHTDEEKPTLVRHRFRKDQKSHGKSIAVLFVIVILAALFAALYFTGNITFGGKESTTKKAATTEATTSIEDKYKGTIVVKDMYIFVDGKEVDGLEGLQKAIEYETPSTTAYKIIDENANSDFLNNDILELLTQLKFYGEDTVIEHIVSTGLIAEAETTTLPPETTTKPSTTKAETTTKSNG